MRRNSRLCPTLLSPSYVSSDTVPPRPASWAARARAQPAGRPRPPANVRSRHTFTASPRDRLGRRGVTCPPGAIVGMPHPLRLLSLPPPCSCLPLPDAVLTGGPRLPPQRQGRPVGALRSPRDGDAGAWPGAAACHAGWTRCGIRQRPSKRRRGSTWQGKATYTVGVARLFNRSALGLRRGSLSPPWDTVRRVAPPPAVSPVRRPLPAPPDAPLPLPTGPSPSRRARRRLCCLPAVRGCARTT